LEEKQLGHSSSIYAGAMDPLFEFDLDLPPKGSRGSSRILYVQLRAAILDGRLGAGARLPATRRSGAFFGVSRNTVAEVYEKLLNEGYVVTRHGSGTFVADKIPAPAPSTRSSPRKSLRASASVSSGASSGASSGRSLDQSSAGSPGTSSGVAPRLERTAQHRLNDFWLRPEVASAMSFWRDRPDHPSSLSKLAPVDFRPALVDSRLFPFDVFRRVSAKQLRGLERRPARFKSPQGNQGNYQLREAIVKHITLTRAVVCRSDEVLVTSGAQQAFDLLARALVVPNDTIVAVEDPGYPPMRVAFAAAGARLVPVGVDGEGLMVERIPAGARIICVCPSHQFPLGVTMSMRRRRALVEFARKTGAVIVEDDYDGEFRYDGSPLEALRTAGSADVVFYVGTFSKCMLSALRLGFVVAPEWAMHTLIAAKNCLDWHCSTPVQMGVASFISEGHLARHVRKLREIYKRRRRVLLNSLQEGLAEWLEPIPSFYGMHIAAVGRTSVDLDRVAEELLHHNVKIHTLRRYYLGPPTRAALIFGYGAVDVPEMNRGLSLLRKALKG
jgi:GntR family transcriptional regulator/MocR family aminotransferase